VARSAILLLLKNGMKGKSRLFGFCRTTFGPKKKNKKSPACNNDYGLLWSCDAGLEVDVGQLESSSVKSSFKK